jgi:hypothetical protein
MAEEERAGGFRVYRVVPAVHHLNLQAVDEGASTLYTVYQSGYDAPLQTAVDDLRTGDLVAATLVGDPEDEADPWRLADVEREGGVTLEFAVDTELPPVARDLWGEGRTGPTWTALTDADGNAVGACGVQPRDPLPDGAFVPSVLAGLLPLEPLFESVPTVDEPPAEVLFVDPDPPDADGFTEPYGVVLAFTDEGATAAGAYRERYDLPRGEDSRPEFDPYAV